MPDLESEEFAAQEEQSAKGLKIFTPNQMLSRLPIALAQLKAENNLGNYCILCTDKKNPRKISIKFG